MNCVSLASEDDASVERQKKTMKKAKNRKDTSKLGNDAANPVCRPFSPKSEKYIRKMERLVRIYERISENNTKLRYHMLRVKQESKRLMKVKRHLCNRLSHFNDPYMDQYLEIPDYNHRNVDVDKLIGEVLTNVDSSTPPVNKKRRIDKTREDSKEQDSKKEVINRILTAASSVMQQEEQKGAIKKLDEQVSSVTPIILQNLSYASQNSKNKCATLSNHIQPKDSNAHLITTPLPTSSNNSGAIQMNPQCSTSFSIQVGQNIETTVPIKTDTMVSPSKVIDVTSFPHENVSANSVPGKNSHYFAVVTHQDLPKKGSFQPSANEVPRNEDKSQCIVSCESQPVASKSYSPLHAHISTAPLLQNQQIQRTANEIGPCVKDSQQDPFSQQMNNYSDLSTINPQLLPHRQLNVRKIQEQQLKEEREKVQSMQNEHRRNESESTTMVITPQQQMIIGRQGQMQQIVIPSTALQQMPMIQSQPRLREALQNAGNEVQQRQNSMAQPIQLVQTVLPNQSRIVGSGRGQLQMSTDGTQQSQMIIDDSRVIYIDQSRFTTNELGQMVVPLNMGSQTVRYIVSQGAPIPQAIAISSPKLANKKADKMSERLLRASSIDHLLPQNPDDDPNDDNIDWSKYDEPKPRTKKLSSPRKRGANIKVDANSDAMARISPILAKFQQEMAQSTVAQEQQHQQQIAMAARNATKTVPARARKRPTKAEKEAAAAKKLEVDANLSLKLKESSTPIVQEPPASVSSKVVESEPEKKIELIDQTENDRKIPTIIVTAATPEPGLPTPLKTQPDQRVEDQPYTRPC